VISVTWENMYNTWHERNSKEHDKNGAPETRKKEKVIEHITGISKKMEYHLYKENELDDTTLLVLPIENLQIMELNLKDVRKQKGKK
jgi:hypothetical protein